MSLVGNLEDLGLGEILQIVSLSRKSGSLSLYSRGREGKIVFRHGQVVRAFSNTFHESLGEVLAQKGIVDVQTLKKAVAIQRDGDFTERIGAVLAREFNVPADVIEDVAREQIEKVIYSLFAWAEGTFDFELQDTDDSVETQHSDPLQFRLEHGLNPQFLAIEGSRIIDEMRHRGELPPDGEIHSADGTSPEENVDFAFDLLQSEDARTTAVPEQEKQKLVLVDDHPGTRDALERFLAESDYEVIQFAGGEDALIYVDTVYRAGARPVLLVDLVMPKMDGSGKLGGLELLELVHGNFPDLQVVVMGENKDYADAHRTVSRMGYTVIIKPDALEIEDADAVGLLCRKLTKELQRAKPGTAAGDDTINLGDELRLEMGEELIQVRHSGVQSTGISMLRGILEELNNPALGGGIILLVLRFASEFMNRAVIFIVKKDEVVGLGQFGIVDAAGKADAKVRDIHIPVNDKSLFKEVVDRQMATKTVPDGSPWTTYLLEQLGQGAPTEFFLGPIISEGKVVALLYGDNLPDKSNIGDTDSLEIFLSQAGIAMEKALLQRRLKEKDQEGT